VWRISTRKYCAGPSVLSCLLLSVNDRLLKYWLPVVTNAWCSVHGISCMTMSGSPTFSSEYHRNQAICSGVISFVPFTNSIASPYNKATSRDSSRSSRVIRPWSPQ